jgi:CheY-like chemotaxis protein
MNSEKSNVLIVDPSPLVSGMLSTLLDEYGFITHVAQRGRHALEIMEHKPIDWMCFSCELGDMSGIELFVSAGTRKLLSHQIGCLTTADLRRQILTGALEDDFRKRDAYQRNDGNYVTAPRADAHTEKSEFLRYYSRILERLGFKVSINLVHTANGGMGKKYLTPILAISSYEPAGWMLEA